MQRILFSSLFIVLAALLSCGKPPPPEKPIEKLYRGLSESRDQFPLAAIRGKTIVIDPGHGGRFTGTTGQGGLLEKDVNLGVALYLWGLLHDAGAHPFLTRSIDRDMLGDDDDGNLTMDLAARVTVADSVDADLFLSIHHNARADTNRSVNQIEVYYPMGDPGASLDAARAIHRHLMRNLGIEQGKVLPGNFYVLRENAAPAVLGESSYLSHPPVEKRLSLGETRRLEGEAYFLGIVTYFARGIPECVITSPPAEVTSADQLYLRGYVSDEAGHQGIDPSTIRVTLDGKEVAASYDPAGGVLESPLPPGLSPGRHTLSVTARNLEGNATSNEEQSFRVAFPPARGEVDAIRLPRQDGAVLVTIRLTDERGIPVEEEPAIRVEPGGSMVHPEEGTIVLLYEPGNLPGIFHISGERFGFSLSLPDEGPSEPPGVLLAREGDRPVAGVSVWWNGEWEGRTGAGGRLLLDDPPVTGDYFRVEKEGLHAGKIVQDEGVVTAVFAPRSEFPLRGASIVIDPVGRPEAGLFPPGDQSLALARYLEEMIQWTGGLPHLTRTGLIVPPAAERVRLAGRVGAAYWVTVESGDSYSVTHFPGSREGEPAARAVADALASAFSTEAVIRTGADTVLRDTPCPALRITVPTEGVDGRTARARLRRAAQAIHEGLAERLADGDSPAEIAIGPLTSGALVRIDNVVSFQAATAGSLFVRYPPPGPHLITIEENGSWRTIRYDVEAGEAP